MKKLLKASQKIENFIICIAFIVMILAMFAQVVNRNIVKSSIGWFEEISVFCMIWMAMLGTELGMRDGTQASVTFLVGKLKGTSKKVVTILTRRIIIVLSGVMTRACIQLIMKQMATGQTSAALKIPMYIPYSALLFGFGIMFCVQLTSLVVYIKEMNKEEMEAR